MTDHANEETDAKASADMIRIPVVEERVSIGKRAVETGRVQVHSRVVEDRSVLSETVTSESVSVERVPIGRDIDEVPPVREEDGVVIVPVVEERLIVTRQLVLREEIRLIKREHEETVEIPVSLKRKEIEIERD